MDFFVCWIMGIFIGVFIGAAAFFDYDSAAKRIECEKDLPRSQVCVMQYVPEFK